MIALGPGRPARVLDATSTDAAGALDAPRDKRSLTVGDRIVWGITIACGDCRMCGRDIPNKCGAVRKYGHERIQPEWALAGGIASHLQLRAGTTIVRVPETLPAELLAPAPCATATVMAAISAAEDIRPLTDDVAVVTGCGMLGLTAIAVATASGARVIAVDPDPARRRAALRFGAVSAVASGSDALRAALASVKRDGFDVAFELSGAPASVAALLELADTAATIVLAGSVFPAALTPLSAESVVRRLLTIRGVHNYRPEHLLRAVDFLATADVATFSELVGDIVPLARAAEVFEPRPDAPVRVGIRP